MRPALFVIFLFAVIGSCSKTGTNPLIHGTGTLTGISTGCRVWMIRDQDKLLLQPMNLDSFSITLQAGQAVVFSYYKSNGGNICLNGQPITLVSIEDK